MIQRINATNTKILPAQSVALILKAELTMKPPNDEPIAIPMLNAEMFNADAIFSVPGKYFSES